MRIISRVIVFFILSGIYLTKDATGQQLPLYSQYMMNKFLINPAVAGSEGYTAINLTAREQWLGMKESPKTHALSAQTRVLKNSFIAKSESIKKKKSMSSRSGKVGLGAYIFDDRTGLISRTGIQITYAYHIYMPNKGQLSFGLSGTAYQFGLDKEKIILYEPDDDLLNIATSNLIIPDANVGVYFSNPQFFAGFSASQLFQSSLKFGKQGFENYRLLRHYYLLSGYNVDVSDDIIIVPTVLIKTTENWNFQVDIGGKMHFREDYWGGISFRTGGDVIVMGGVKVNKFYFGYAFDYTLSSIRKHSFGSHEFMIAVKFGDSARRYRWLIRY